MPKYLRQLRDAYCLAPPLPTSTLRPPRLSRNVEVKHPTTPIVEVKREVGSSNNAEFIIDEEFDVKPPTIEYDPRQLQRSIAALAIAPPLGFIERIRRCRSSRPIKLGSALSASEQDPRGEPRPSGPASTQRPPKGFQNPAKSSL